MCLSLALSAALALASSAVSPGVALADTEAQMEVRPQAPTASEVAWNDAWARFRVWEYVATGAAWTQALVVRFVATPHPSRGTWALDVRITSALSASGTLFDVAETVADVGYLGSIAYRLLDSTVVPGLIWGSGDVALQMTMIDLEAFAIAAVVLWNAQWIYGRERPAYRDCPVEARQDVDCEYQDDGRYRSFIAGHTLVTTTAAALTCVHHAHLPLYGGGVADDLACAGMIGLAAASGVARVMLEKHYPTDTLLAWAIGTLAGYVVPSALHYGFGSAPRPSATAQQRSAPESVRVTVIPAAGTSTLGATLAGTF